jgi:hypothetical protein
MLLSEFAQQDFFYTPLKMALSQLAVGAISPTYRSPESFDTPFRATQGER